MGARQERTSEFRRVDAGLVGGSCAFRGVFTEGSFIDLQFCDTAVSLTRRSVMPCRGVSLAAVPAIQRGCLLSVVLVNVAD